MVWSEEVGSSALLSASGLSTGGGPGGGGGGTGSEIRASWDEPNVPLMALSTGGWIEVVKLVSTVAALVVRTDVTGGGVTVVVVVMVVVVGGGVTAVPLTVNVALVSSNA